uniref:Titin n=1 Tax=Oryzias melastigma TaxID=30732 RepID=A0A3B3C504_ORYME
FILIFFYNLLYITFIYTAANQVGESEPRELHETILAKDILVPPEVVVDVSCRDALTVRAGQIISLICRVKGRPDPEITWTKDARALSRDKRTEINNSYPLCELVISDAMRSDYGKYAIFAKNSSGQVQATIVVNILDIPGPCQNLKTAYATKKSCTEITQYIIECRQPSQRGWTVVSNDWTKRLIKAPLTEGCEYFFRVSAENKIGAGPSTETKTPVLAVDPIEKPGEPIDLHISEIGKTFCFLKWKKPDNDGGSRNLGYHIEKKPKEADEWERIHKGAIKETYFMADRCIENQIYQFRVQTKNEGGESNWVTTDEITVKEHLEEPEIKIKLEGVLTVRAGDTIAIEATVKGKPQPDVKWTKDDSTEEIRKSSRLQIETGADFSKILLTGAKRTDSGKYYIMASNSAGSCSANAVVNVLDRAGPIRDLKISGITVDRCHLAWEIPEDDGGCDIYNYIIEKCETKRGVWSVHSNAVITNKSDAIVAGTQFNVPDAPEVPEVTKIGKEDMTVQWSEPEKNGGKPITGYLLEKKEEHAIRWTLVNKDPIPGTRFTVSGLLPLHDYQYRVKAVNEIGIGNPSKASRSITAKDVVGM